MKTCCVLIPFGVKVDPTSGVAVDFDRVFQEIVKPAAEQASVVLLRPDVDVAVGLEKRVLGAILSSDILLADVTTARPEVMYQLGVRHALNRGPTVLVCAASDRAPFLSEYLRVVRYDLSRLDQSRALLADVFRASARSAEGSPLYEFFPELRVELPTDLRTSRARSQAAYSQSLRRQIARTSRARYERALAQRPEELLRAAGPDLPPEAHLDVLRGYRAAGDWDGLIRAAESLPPEVATDRHALQLLALALNRRMAPGDQERAVTLMRQLVAETGGDSEAFGILGKIYKDRWKAGASAVDLDEAEGFYRRAFDLEPTDYYAGFNAAALLFLRDTPSADNELALLLPRVKAVISPRLVPEAADVSALATAIEIAVIERNWSWAAELVDRLGVVQPAAWMRASSAESVERLGRRLEGPDAEQLARVVERLRSSAEPESDDDA